ncbi:hypothetical protein B0H16DRAFT_1475534 [Mycena metata]|uniref:Uncharacterized protein n=1 Tax=Mycena metata TaxID=1033252 RepID=A0AAD7HDX9_9AGAR|nr:hypothetical protein B0H16DRAFT_1475534 [Mycena metata]
MSNETYNLHDPPSYPSIQDKHRRGSTVSDGTEDKSSSSDSSVNFEARRLLNREDRALCRVLVGQYNISSSTIHERFPGWAIVTIDKAVVNGYKPRDEDVDKDQKFLPHDFNNMLREMIDMQRAETARSKGRHEKEIQKSTKASPQRHSITRPSSAGTTSHESVFPAPFAIAGPSRTGLVPEDRFLWDLVANVPLDHVWYIELKKAGFTEGKIRRIAAVADQDIDAFMKRTFPAMTELDRFLFIIFIKGSVRDEYFICLRKRMSTREFMKELKSSTWSRRQSAPGNRGVTNLRSKFKHESLVEQT